MNFEGLILIHKESGPTSHDIVSSARRILNTKAIGHAGTLDPMAEGLMVLLIGKATKLSNYFLEGDKAYHAKFELGKSSDTFDATGIVQSDANFQAPSLADVQEQLASMNATLNLEVPIYSAIKVDGKKLYEYARSEQEVQIPVKEMRFYNIEMLNYNAAEVEVRLSCSKGSYIRSFGCELGKRFNTGAIMTYLKREYSTPYSLDHALRLEQLGDYIEKQDFSHPAFISVEDCLPYFPYIQVAGQDERLLRNGQISHALSSRLKILEIQNKLPIEEKENFVIKVKSQETGKLLAILQAKGAYSYKIGNVFSAL